MILLFAGPSLYGAAQALPADVVLRPPAIAGDVARAIVTALAQPGDVLEFNVTPKDVIAPASPGSGP